MSKAGRLIMFFLLLALITPVSAGSTSRGQLWQKVEEAKSGGLPKTAIEHLEPIYEMAMRENDMADAARALAERIVLEGNIQGNRPEEKIVRLQAETDQADDRIQPLLQIILARWYRHYYSRNRRRFMDRSRTEGLAGDDFTTWDLPRLFEHIANLYDAVLDNEEILKKTPISALDGFLEPGNQPEKLRPTLFDFFAHEALEFFMHDDQSIARPVMAFEVEVDSPVLDSADRFMAWKPETLDMQSGNYRAILLLQRLLKHSRASMNLDAELDNDLIRLQWAGRVAAGDNVSSRYMEALKIFAEKNRSHSSSAVAWGLMAEEMRASGDNVGALKICEETIEKWPDSYGATLCRSTRGKILEKSISVQTEKVLRRSDSQALIRYRNIDRVYFRLYRRQREDLFISGRSDPDRIGWNDYPEILKGSVLMEWDTYVDPGDEYKSQEAIVDLPDLQPGIYYLAASLRRDFKSEANSIMISPVTVSGLAMSIRREAGNLTVYVNDAESGEPLQRMRVNRKASEYVRGDWQWKHVDSVVTDSDGRAVFSHSRDRGVFLVESGDDMVYAAHSFQGGGEYSPRGARQSLYLFTDRAIYRPGQMVYFKGVAVSHDTDRNDYQSLAGHRVRLRFTDPNWQTVREETFITNEYGSFSGVFTAPHDRLTGRYTINSDMGGSASIRVEEYKRPGFRVDMELPDRGQRLEEQVSISGKALAYTGAAVDRAQVRYRVIREVRVPRWCWWYVHSGAPAEIAHGTTKTDINGGFDIEFLARPDRSVPRDTEPVFRYTIQADVTDAAGETRSGKSTLQIGYTAMGTSVSIPETVEAGSDIKAVVRTETHDRQGVSAKGTVSIHVLKQPDRTHRKGYFSGMTAAMADRSDIRTWPVAELMDELPLRTPESGLQSFELELPEGAYRISVQTQDDFGTPVNAKADFLVIDKRAPEFRVRVPFIVYHSHDAIQPGEMFTAVWATGYDSGPAYVEIQHRGKVLQSFWTEPGASKAVIQQRVTEDMRGGFAFSVMQIKENRSYFHTEAVNVPWSDKKLDLKFERMRSVMEPGEETVWRIRISGPEAETGAIEMLAGMYDASLDAFAEHSWHRNIPVFYRHPSAISPFYVNRAINLNTWLSNIRHAVSIPRRVYPALPESVRRDFMHYQFPSVVFSGMPGEMRRSRTGMEDIEADGMKLQAMAEVAEEAVPAKAMEDAAELEDSPDPDMELDDVAVRENLDETAFFYPHLLMDEDGIVTIEFTMPEALTTWNFLGFAHGKKLQSGFLEGETITRKELMVQPNPPRFIREGDKIRYTARVVNMSESAQQGQIRLRLQDPVTLEDRNKEFGIGDGVLDFSVPPGESRTSGWTLNVPDTAGMIQYTVVAASQTMSDGEKGLLPILSRRLFVTESLPLPVRGPDTVKARFEKLLQSAESDTLEHMGLTVDVTSNPAWYAVQALPYLMEYPHRGAEQIFNRIYSNSVARFIVRSNPKIERVFKAWKADEAQGGEALLSNLEKNEHLKSVALMETPWVLNAQNETERKRRIALLFDRNRVENEIKRAMNTLADMQLHDGAFPWFPGGRANTFITLYIMTGFGRMRNMDISLDMSIALKTLEHLDNWICERYNRIIKIKDYEKRSHIDPTVAMYLYGRSFFMEEHPILPASRDAVNFFIRQAREHWLKVGSRMSQGHLALAMMRLGDRSTAMDIVASIRERSVHDNELGMFWRESEGAWWWYNAEIETQAIMIEMFDEVANDRESVEECKIWLLKQKQTQDWRTTKATADAVYALLLRGADLLASDRIVKMYLDGREVQPERVEAGTGHYQKIYQGAEVTPNMGNISMVKEDKGIAWGSVHWQYMEDMSRITPHETNLKLEKSVFVKRYTDRGPVITPVKGPVNTGDLLVIRIVLETDRNMEYVHMKDGRGSGLEPVNVLSGYRWQDGLSYYEATLDTATHFYMDYLPKGVYVFEYELWVQHQGEYQTGMAEIQCMYAPEFNSHSGSMMLTVKEQGKR